MLVQDRARATSGIFITFAGNCKKALTSYQKCFGGSLYFEVLETKLEGYTEEPIISGSLISSSIIIHGSDLVHDEGREIGNYIAVFLSCKTIADRKLLAERLTGGMTMLSTKNWENQKLIEITDLFDVRWVLSI